MANETAFALAKGPGRRKQQSLQPSRLRPPQQTNALKLRRTPFRFLDLPPEIRNRIYHLAVQESRVIPIRDFVMPAITRACQQLRGESLPIFFNVNTFVAKVRSSWTFIDASKRMTPKWRAVFLPENDPKLMQVGTLQLRRGVLSMFRHAGQQSLRVRNLDISMLRSNCNEVQTAMLSLRSSDRPGASTVTVDVYLDSFRDRDITELVEDVTHITDNVKSILEKMISDEAYAGLSIVDLKKVANAFRATPRERARIPR